MLFKPVFVDLQESNLRFQSRGRNAELGCGTRQSRYLAPRLGQGSLINSLSPGMVGRALRSGWRCLDLACIVYRQAGEIFWVLSQCDPVANGIDLSLLERAAQSGGITSCSTASISSPEARPPVPSPKRAALSV